MHFLERLERKPVHCIWEITNACNLHCIHCNNHSVKPLHGELSFEKIIDVAQELSSLGCEVVNVSGGEPFLRPEWDRICLFLSNLGIAVAITTNGTLLTRENVDKAFSSGVKIIAVSIDGLKEFHDKNRTGKFSEFSGLSPFERAIEGIRYSIEKIETMVITQVNCTNLNQLSEIRALLRELGIRRWQLQLCVPTINILEMDEPYVISPEDLEFLTDFIVQANSDGEIPFIETSDTIGYYTEKEPFLRKREKTRGLWLGCMAGIRLIAIKPDGKVRGCSLMPSEFDAGDLHLETLREIWEDKERFSYSTKFSEDKFAGGCRKCKYHFICRGGCRTMAFWATGTIYDNPYCLYRLKQIENQKVK